MSTHAERKFRIPLYVPSLPAASELTAYFEAIDTSKRYTNFGCNVIAFEREVLDYLDRTSLNSHGQVTDVVSTANGTLALVVALRALQLPPGTRVLIPAYTFVATAAAVVEAGLTPLLSDIDPGNWQLTPEIAEETLDRIPFGAVMPVTPYGYPIDLGKWSAFEYSTNVPVVVDAAAAFGNQAVGAVEAVIFSLHATKILPAAEGGLLCMRDTTKASLARRLTNFGLDGLVLTGVGTNAKMSEYHAAIARCQLARLPEIIAGRLDVYRRYLEALSCTSDHARLVEPGKAIPSVAALVCIDSDTRDRIESALIENGVETRRGYHPTLEKQQALGTVCEFADNTGGFANSSDWERRLLCIPFFVGMSSEQIATVSEIIRDAIR